MPDEGIDDEAVVRLGDAEEGPREDVAISVAELVGGVRYLSPAAELIKRQATRKDIGFAAIMESELVVFLAALVEGDLWWYPGSLLYAEYGRVPAFFLRATRHADFAKLGRILGVEEGGELRRIVSEN